MEKIKLSLWDTFAFISSSIVLHLAFVVNELLLNGKMTEFSENLDVLPILDGYIWLVLCISYFLLTGMIFEPVANIVYDWIYKLVGSKNYYNEEELSEMAEFIKKDIFQTKGFLIKGNPFHFVKDSLIDTGHASLFLVFLSKYGFYRSCAVTFLFVSFRNMFVFNCASLLSLGAFLALAVICYRRTKQFYDYQAPTLYRTYLMGLKSKSSSLENL